MASHLQEDKKVISWARLNQLTVERFKAGEFIYVRDRQYGNYRSYKVSTFSEKDIYNQILKHNGL